MSRQRVRVLVVDDSAFARKVVRESLELSPHIEVVGIARDGLDALEKIADLAPDVITLDLVMPNLDGLGVLQALQGLPGRPVVVVVSMADEDSELGVAALATGAFEVVKKPTALAIDRLYDLGDGLRATVLAAAEPSARRRSRPPPSRPPRRLVRKGDTQLVVISASTGGPQAITALLRALPARFPVPLAVVVHMPLGYTEAFAQRLDAACDLDVLEARDGLPLRPGLAIIARAGAHLVVTAAEGQGWACRLDAQPDSAPHRPSVDALFESAAREAKNGTLGVVLTGMGADGRQGAGAIRAAGGRVFTESESSCVVYGMPRSVVDAGFSDAQSTIEGMAALIQENL
ncbi:MAG: chemotaxis-specific protein-glutamate methyltransferase CheB [Polyangiaceae bacterium]